MNKKEIGFGDLLGLYELALKNEIEALKKELKKDISVGLQLVKQGYSISEFAQITGLSYDAVKGRIKRKTLRAIRDGNTYLIPKKEVDRFVHQLKRA